MGKSEILLRSNNKPFTVQVLTLSQTSPGFYVSAVKTPWEK